MDEFINAYVTCNRALLIAPAGHGKTHALADCVKVEHERGNYPLILTHTHAGIASIKEKMRQEGIPAEYAHVETILGFAQRYVLAYVSHTQLPAADDGMYFPTILQKAVGLLAHSVIQSVITASYDSVYVDEYQDCTREQNQFVQLLADILPMHLMGDELQGIFDFDQLVSFDADLSGYMRFDFLITPWRWRKVGNCAALGDMILEVRHLMESGTDVDLKNYVCDSFQYSLLPPGMDEVAFHQAVGRLISKIQSRSVLILVPNIAEDGHPISIGERAKILSQIDYRRSFTLLDAIDDRSYYSCAKEIDTFVTSFLRIRNPYKHLCAILHALTFNKTDYSPWVNEHRIVTRTGENRGRSEQLMRLYETYSDSPSYANLYSLIGFFAKEIKCKMKRPMLCRSVLKALRNAEGTSAYSQMVQQKNKLRQTGRKVEGLCMGTTLLTKGLEFDDVIIFDAQLFDKKNFYVAISRACKHLVIFTRRQVLNFD